MAKVFPFSALPTADRVIDAAYEGGIKGNAADDVLGKLIPSAGIKADSARSVVGMRHVW
jgi:hypothetical protein